MAALSRLNYDFVILSTMAVLESTSKKYEGMVA